MQRIVGRSRPWRCGDGFGRAAAACGGWQPLNPSARSHMPPQRRQFPREFGSGVHQGDGGVIGKFGTSELLPNGVTRHLDFFGESVTFSRDASASTTTDVSDAVASLDNMMMCIISRGSANIHNGHDGEGPEARANHSSAMAWSDLLRHAGAWESREGSTSDGRSNTSAPMLAVAAVAPCLAQGGVNYVRRIDRLLSVSAERGPCLLKLAHEAASLRDAVTSVSKDTLQETYIYSQRERLHLHALHHLLQNKHRIALGSYLRILELCPGDLFALSLAIDVANAIGDSSAAMRAATNVSAYWAERDSGAINYAHPAVNLAAALVSVGLSSRASTAERLAETSLARDPDGSGGVAIWALVHCWGSEGRSSELISKLTADGAKCYEACGYLNFHAKMKAYGGISLLDRMGAGADRSAVRLYDGGMGLLLAYTGNSVEGLERGGEEVCLREKRLPKSVRREIAGSMFSGLFGRGEAKNEDQVTAESDSQKPKLIRRRTREDILCWLPPSPLDLSIATAFLLRLTLSEGISEQDERWYDLRAAWQMALEQNESAEEVSIDFMPGAMLAASLLIHPDDLHSNVNCVSPQLESAMIGLHRMGQLMMLGRTFRQAGVVKVDRAEQWRDALKYLARASDCLRWEIGGELVATTPFHIPTKEATSKIAWDFDLRQFLEYSVCHAALQVGDYESLCLARSICSEGITLRANCPEIWYRYSNVLEMLGDEVGAENARSASVSLGFGEGASAVSL